MYKIKYVQKHQKMALGVGEKEVQFITDRYNKFKEIFLILELWDKEAFKRKRTFISLC